MRSVPLHAMARASQCPRCVELEDQIAALKGAAGGTSRYRQPSPILAPVVCPILVGRAPHLAAFDACLERTATGSVRLCWLPAKLASASPAWYARHARGLVDAASRWA